MTDLDAQQTLNDLLHASIEEQRRARRWRIFFRFLAVALFLFIVLPAVQFSKPVPKVGPHVGVVEIQGIINAEGKGSYHSVAKALKKMYKNEHLKGVILDINSQGGMPAQGHMIFEEVRRLKSLHPEIPVYASISDIGASAAYYIACAADEIVAAPSSIVGSIGVISFGFGAVDALKKLGLESRVQTAGEHKAFLNPFQPVSDEEITFKQALLDNVHAQFINAVKLGRGDRLTSDEKIFSGLYWTGEQALALGLIDDLSTTESVAREKIGVEELVVYNRNRDFLASIVDNLPTETTLLHSVLQSKFIF
jgi:protease-4